MKFYATKLFFVRIQLALSYFKSKVKLSFLSTSSTISNMKYTAAVTINLYLPKYQVELEIVYFKWDRICSKRKMKPLFSFWLWSVLFIWKQLYRGFQKLSWCRLKKHVLVSIIANSALFTLENWLCLVSESNINCFKYWKSKVSFNEFKNKRKQSLNDCDIPDTHSQCTKDNSQIWVLVDGEIGWILI